MRGRIGQEGDTDDRAVLSSGNSVRGDVGDVKRGQRNLESEKNHVTNDHRLPVLSTIRKACPRRYGASISCG